MRTPNSHTCTILIRPYSSSSSTTLFFFFFNDTATTEIYTLSLHDALPISVVSTASKAATPETAAPTASTLGARVVDRKSTRLNSSHVRISYAVFCLKKKKKKKTKTTSTIIKSKHNTNLITYC